jgi:hypothetical protein
MGPMILATPEEVVEAVAGNSTGHSFRGQSEVEFEAAELACDAAIGAEGAVSSSGARRFRRPAFPVQRPDGASSSSSRATTAG